jgi:primosomal protein N' (replication factor Y)
MGDFARVSVNVPSVTGQFDYLIPLSLRGRVLPGCLVEVPFGAQDVQGVVLEVADVAAVAEVRPVSSLLDEQPVVTPAQLRLAAEISREFICPQAAALDLMLPPGLSQRADTQVKPLAVPAEVNLSDLERPVYELLVAKNGLRGRQLQAAFPALDWRKALAGLRAKNIIHSTSFLPAPTVQPKMVRTAVISVDGESIDRYLAEQKAKRASGAQERRARALTFLRQAPAPVPAQWVYAETGCTLVDLQTLAAEDLVALGETEWLRDPLADRQPQPEASLTLTAAQQNALDAILNEWQSVKKGGKAAPILLDGVTGSGKTEVYLRAAQQVIDAGQQVIYLVPEISLTPQTVRRLVDRFPGKVGLYHSGLSAGERYDTWRRARSERLSIVAGPRSALFMPFPRLGLIIVDECHDDSYCQGEYGPYYDARQAAVTLARLAGAVCVLGSATPNTVQIYQAERENWKYRQLPERVWSTAAGDNPAQLPAVEVVDMRAELRAGNHSILSVSLQQALKQVLAEKQQAILYLNRRGKATHVFCRACGFILECPRCNLALTAHGERGDLVCHQCGYTRALPKVCPACNSAAIRQLGAGTETVEAEVHRLFPAAQTLRWDAETTRFKGSHEIILEHFTRHRADILIGTQMVSKGLDIPQVSLVGVILAETGLVLPDYRAAERTYQHLVQVAGRAGRSEKGGSVIFQTYQPENPVITAAAAQNTREFIRAEMEARHSLGYPPFTHLVRLEFTDLISQRAEQAASRAAGLINDWVEKGDRQATRVLGPAPCYYPRLNNRFRWQVVVRGPDPASLIWPRVREMAGARIEVDPPNLL